MTLLDGTPQSLTSPPPELVDDSPASGPVVAILWSVNVEDDYHEESAGGGTGRDAPIVHAGLTWRTRAPRPSSRAD